MQAEVIRMVAMSPRLLEKEEKLVRCKGCKHAQVSIDGDGLYCEHLDHFMSGDWFCADGEERGK